MAGFSAKSTRLRNTKHTATCWAVFSDGPCGSDCRLPEPNVGAASSPLLTAPPLRATA